MEFKTNIWPKANQPQKEDVNSNLSSEFWRRYSSYSFCIALCWKHYMEIHYRNIRNCLYNYTSNVASENGDFSVGYLDLFIYFHMQTKSKQTTKMPALCSSKHPCTQTLHWWSQSIHSRTCLCEDQNFTCWLWSFLCLWSSCIEGFIHTSKPNV